MCVCVYVYMGAGECVCVYHDLIEAIPLGGWSLNGH